MSWSATFHGSEMYALLLIDRSDSSKGCTVDVLPLPAAQDKTESTGALVKAGNDKTKTTPAGEYLTAALMDFDPDQFESFAAIADGANKLLMLVCISDKN